MKIRAAWTGLPPNVGDYVMSTMRPKYAYRVLGVGYDGIETATEDHKTTITTRKLALDVERVSPHHVPDDAVVHSWKWDQR